MELSATDRRLLDALGAGLALVPRPFAEIARSLGLDEAEVIARAQAFASAGLIKRFGVVVRHRAIGYGANAMVVWDVLDADVSDVGRRMAANPFVTLCYRRPRRLPDWPYNLFSMIHGRDRTIVEAQVAELSAALGLDSRPRAILFSMRCFKQRGARYGASSRTSSVEAAE